MRRRRIQWLDVLAWVFIAWVMLFAFRVADAGVPLNAEQARGIYTVAWGQTHHLHQGNRDVLHAMPPVHVLQQADLCTLAHPDLPPDCRILGLYRDATVYVSDALDFTTVEHASILLHEFVHHIQTLTLGEVTGCADNLAREIEARKIQAKVLMAARAFHAARIVQFDAVQMRCPTAED